MKFIRLLLSVFVGVAIAASLAIVAMYAIETNCQKQLRQERLQGIDDALEEHRRLNADK